MIERVARAMCARKYKNDFAEHVTPDWFIEEHWQDFVDQARAAIEAMREPTPAMRMVFLVEMVKHSDSGRAFTAMIDAALQETE